MATEADQSISTVVHAVINNIQEIVRGEVSLVKAEVTGEARKLGASVKVIAIGAVLAVYGAGLLLWGGVYALSQWLPLWASAALIGGLLALSGTVALSTGLKRLAAVRTLPARAIAALKDH